MPSINSQTTSFNIIIQIEGYDTEMISNLLLKYLHSYKCNYAYILHNKDLDNEGNIKKSHLHLIIYNFEKRKRLSTMINELSEKLEINPFAITIDTIKSLEGSIQYLIHKNDIEKYHYDKCEIITNINDKELDLLLEYNNSALSFDRLFQTVLNAKNKTEIMQQIGISYYQHYRGVISDIWNDYRLN